MDSIPDRIEKQVHLRAPQSRVWRAISDAREFGAWFGVEFAGPFVEGGRLTGKITPTKVDPEVAALQEPHAGVAFDITIEAISPERLFAFRWHPELPGEKTPTDAVTTLVEFRLEATADGTLLRLSESGFSKVPLERRAQAFTSNEGGWTHQMKLIEKYLQLHA